uniref:EF-hand calcium-binding domain-containing protein 5-like n=1 Tax=Ciona intestinalis TaxID=7719 RepID=UPI00089DB30A|nr:EF-hand calcium-binding domain-containing protein 5-like [Ciona intestinalis]|eukprot:XP_026695158.1 EF-hand calcium-binding domain-containing protein 5-like [Ciona intestinalis]
MASPVVSSQALSTTNSSYTDDQSFIYDDDTIHVKSTIPSRSYDTSISQSNESAEQSTFSSSSSTRRTQSSKSEVGTVIEESSVQQSSARTSVSSPTSFERKWLQEQAVFVEQRILTLQKQKKKRLRDAKAAALKLERTLPMDMLAQEWFSENAVTSEMRVYLIDKLLPTLVLGVEKVLLEAEKKGLIEGYNPDGETSRKFNPINLLAQYLMRNIPKYSNLSETSPYIRGLRAVAENLKRDVFDLEANKLAKLKMEARRQREAMEARERQKTEDRLHRERLLKLQYSQWLADSSGRVQLQLIQNALFSHLEISSHLASDSEKVVHYSKELEATDETGITLTEAQYVEYVEQYVNEMTRSEFSQLLRHLDQCALAFRKTFEHEVWREMFVKLFKSLDNEETGVVDRHRMLHLLEKFYDKVDADYKESLNNPRKWPVIELEELDDLYPDSEEEGSEDTVLVSTEDMTSSDWASVPISNLTGEEGAVASDEVEVKAEPVEQEEDETLVEDGGDKGGEEEDKLEETTEQVTPEEDKEDKTEIKDEENVIKEESEENKETEDETADDIDKLSAKVSSAAGEGSISSVGSKEGSVVAEEKEDQPDAEDVTTPQTQDVVKDEVTSPKPGTPEETVEKTDDDAQIEKEEKLEVSTNEVEDEKSSSQDGDDVKDDAANIEVTSPDEPEVKEDTKEEVEPVRTAFDASKLMADNEKGISLITPAPSTDGSMDVGPVNVQFSKEVSRPPVRKTTSFTTVQKKKLVVPAQDLVNEESEKVWGHDARIGETSVIKTIPTVEKTIGISESQDGERDSETIVTTTAAGGSEAIVVQNTADEMYADDYYPQPMEVKTRPASASRMSVTFAAEPLILPDRPSAEFFSHYSSRSQSRMTSVFDENQLNQGRFVTLLDNFVCDETNHITVEQLVNFIHGGYVETEEEKMSRLARARKEVLSAKHRQMVDNLFNKWDNDGQGHLDIDEVEDVLSKYKGGMESSALKRGRQAVRQLRKHTPYHDRRRLNKPEFHVFINTVCTEMSGGEEVFDGVVEYATTTVERTYAERVRGDARRKWLAQIKSAAESGGASMDSVYRAVFQTLNKDADSHGNQKKMSAYVGLLEHNLVYPHRGNVLLRYVACTPDNSPYMLGKAFYEDMRGISFYAIRRGKLVHVPRVQSHGRVYFWNPTRNEGEREGSLVLVPLRDARRRTYGLLGVDNVEDAANADRSIFSSHEINFYQGVAKTFSNAFHHVDLRRKLLRIIDAAMSWVHSRAPRVRTIVVYFVEPDPKSQAGHVLRKMMTADNNTGVTITHSRPTRLYRKDNLFRDYLFNCMENSETTSADAYGERHTAYPLRDEEGRCQCVLDISIGKLRTLPSHERREVQRMLKLLQAANREVMKESKSGEKTVVLEAEERGTDETRVDIMFDRLMLTDLRENVSKLDNNVFAELKNYKIPPKMIHNILKAVLLLFNYDPEKNSELDDWVTCKQMVTGKLRQQILTYDPTSDKENGDTEDETDAVVEAVGKLLKGIAHGAVGRHGSRPAQQLYNWAFVCLSLIEHARKMRANEGQPAVTPVTSASTNATTESGAEQKSEAY